MSSVSPWGSPCTLALWNRDVLTTGDRVDRFVVEDFLGEGGLARVYRVRHENLGGQYALKMLSFRGSRLSKRLVREGRIQARLQHPNIVRVHDAFELDGRGALLMEYVKGHSLDNVLNESGPFPLGEALRIFGQMLAGVGAAHQAGVLHRDLKPGNILLESHGGRLTAKVTDFGIARLLSAQGGDGDTLQSDVIGTPGYMAPEQASDPTAVDVRADLFSLGAILYGMVTGWPPFALSSLAEVLAAAERGDFVPVRERAPDCPETVVRVIESCLSPDPSARFGSCHELAAALFGGDSAEAAAVALAAQRGPVGLAEADSEETRLPQAAALPTGTSPADRVSASPQTEGGPPNATAVPVPSHDPAVPRAEGDRAGISAGPVLAAGLLLLIGVAAGLLYSASEDPPRELAAAPVPLETPADGASPPPTPVGVATEAVGTPEPVVPPPTENVAVPAQQPPADSPTAEAGRSEPAPAASGAVPAPAPAPAPGPEQPEATGAPDPAAGASASPSSALDAPVAGPVPTAEADEDASVVAELEPFTESDEEAEPPETPPPVAAPASLLGTWSGRLGGRASKLRITSQDGAEVRAVLEVLQGTAYRTFRMVGSLDGDRLRLRGTSDPPWMMDVRLVGGALDGALTAPGRKKATAWRGTRD